MNTHQQAQSTIEEQAGRIVNHVAGEIVRLFRPRSIILTGSFGRDEVTAVVRDGQVEFYSDCEVNIVTPRLIPRAEVERLADDVKARFNIDLSVYGLKVSLFLLFPGLHRWLKPTMQNYDLKYGSKVIYGENYLPRIPDFKPDDIPFREGLRLMFNRMAEGLPYLSMKGEPDSRSAFWMYKVLLACQDVILLYLHRYDPSYRARNAIFQKVLPEHVRDLNATLPEFLDLARQATSFKLTGESEDCSRDGHLPPKVAQIADQVFRWALAKEMNIYFGDYVQFQRIFMQRPWTDSGSYAFGALLQNTRRSVEMLFLDREYMSPRLMRRLWLPWTQTVYSVIPLVYFAATPEGEPRRPYLDRARQVLSLFKDLEAPNADPLLEYDYLRQETTSLWRAMCY